MSEFKDAYADFNASVERGNVFLSDEAIINIQKSLLIADRLMQEPSIGMKDVGSGYVMTRTGHIDCFKDMREQMLREIDGEH